jgi:hypothetical protein
MRYLCRKKAKIGCASELKNELVHFVLLSACAIFAPKNNVKG